MEQNENPTVKLARPDWQCDPREFVRRANESATDDIADGLLTIPFAALADAEAPDRALVSRVLGVAEAIRDANPYGGGSADRYVTVGRAFQFPANRPGIAALRIARLFAAGAVKGGLGRFAEEGSTFRNVAEALRSVQGFAEGVRNATETDLAPGAHVVFKIHLERRADLQAQLPTLSHGSRWTRSVLAPKVEGYEFDGSEIDSWMESTGACMEGTIDFLRTIGADVETEGESYECDSCGSESEGDDPSIYSCGDFELDAKTVRLLDRAGYLEQTEEWIREQGDGGDWEGFADLATADVLDEFGPREATEEGKAAPGVRYDSNVWKFELDADRLEGLEELESAPLLAIGGKLALLSAAHADAGSLPPLPGRLTSRCRVGSREAVTFHWDPEAGILSSGIAPRVTLRLDVRDGSQSLRIESPDGVSHRFESVRLDDLGAFGMPQDSAGLAGSRFLRAACGDVDL